MTGGRTAREGSGRSPEETARFLARGAVDCVRLEELVDRLRASRAQRQPLRVKLGVDPTAPDIHLGHAVPLRKLRDFQDEGHVAVLILGDATALVGDPSGRNQTRPVVTREQIEANATTYLEQVRRILREDRLEVRRNSEWFSKLDFAGLIALAASGTVARLLERDDFEQRMKAAAPIGLHELLYPLLQARDSVEVRADVELGGSDQLFNLLMGRSLQREAGQRPQICLTLPLLEGTDGVQKMSKSLGNGIGVTEPAPEMYGKVLSLPDALMEKYFTLLTALGEEDIRVQLGASTHPKEAKKRLAREIVSWLHDAASARRAEEEFERVFRDKGLPEHVETFRVSPEAMRDGGIWIVRLLRSCEAAASNGEARRLIASGAVRIDGTPWRDDQADVPLEEPRLLQVGKRFFRTILAPGDPPAVRPSRSRGRSG